MPRPHREPTFLPLTRDVANSVWRSTPPSRGTADAVRRSAHGADAAAAECWAALLAGCDTPGCRALPDRLRELSEALSVFAGSRWWNGSGTAHRQRIRRAVQRIEEALAERDGADFAEAFVGYDQAVATTLVNACNRLERSAR